MAILAGYIGFLLLGCACLAIGQFFSALTDNQIVAALITTVVLLAFWFVGHLQAFQTSALLRYLVGYLSFAAHFGEFIQGLIRSESVAYFLLVGAAALILNVAYLLWKR